MRRYLDRVLRRATSPEPEVSLEAFHAQCDRDRVTSKKTSGGGGIAPPVVDDFGAHTDERFVPFAHTSETED